MNVQTSRPIPGAVATAGVNERVAFIRRTYAHLTLAVFAFTGISFYCYQSGLSEIAYNALMTSHQYAWGGVLIAFMAVGWVADRWAQSDTSSTVQYLGLGLYVVAEAAIFTPMIYFASLVPGPVIQTAAVLTILMFAGLTGTVFITKKDFSFLRGALGIGSMAALGLIGASILFGGFNLGMLFSVGMIALASGYILYYTSRVLAHYRPSQHVAASLALFSALALLFWYVLRIVIELRR